MSQATPAIPRQPLRILFLVWKLGGGGAERQLAILAAGLAQRGHRVCVGVFRRGGEHEAELEANGVQVASFEKAGFWDLLGFFRRVLKIARALQPDIAHGYMDTGNIVASCLRPFLRRTRIVWGIRGSALESHRYDTAGRLLFQVNRCASRTADVVLVNSRTASEHMAAVGYPAERLKVIPNGIDTDFFRPVPQQGSALREKWRVPRGAVVIGMAGRLDPMKDHATFARAARVLARRRDDVHFVCVGEGVEPYRSAALSAIGEPNLGERLQWKGQLWDMPAFYAAIDLLVSSSAFGESFSNVVAEAMACGVPCVVTDVGDAGDIVGSTGLIVPPRDPAAMADACERMLGQLGPERAAACRDRIVKQFSVARLVDATEEAFYDLRPATTTRRGSPF